MASSMGVVKAVAASGEEREALLAAESGNASVGDPLLSEARRRFQACAEWENPWRPLFVHDIKFANGDDENSFQWPNSIRRSRDVSARPCLTMNVIRQHNLQILNEGLKNKLQVQVLPTGGGATVEAARMLQDICMDVQYRSMAQDSYAVARKFQIEGGIGYWRLATDYAGPDTFEQEINILPITDPFGVYLDKSIKTKSGLDAEYGFIFDRVPKEEFLDAYPKLLHLTGLTPLGVSSGESDWIDKNNTIVCEYFRRVSRKDELLSFIDPASGMRKAIRVSELPPNAVDRIASDRMTKRRDVWVPTIEWKLFVGEECIDETIWPGAYIPIIRCVGEETVINGVLDRKGHTRAMIGAQRMFNYNVSAQVEFVALQSKTPWIGAAKSIQNFESLWNTANNENHSFLPYNHLDDQGNEIPPNHAPRRQDPPTAAPAYEQGASTAFTQMMMVSGQWQNEMGMAGAERTGSAIDKRLDQGDTATYHFKDNFMTALVATGTQIIDLIPKIYDSKRILKIHGSDGEDMDIMLDPGQGPAAIVKRDKDQKIVARILNPGVGTYQVRAAPGQSATTGREQTVEALTLILTQAPTLTAVVGDLLLGAMDFPAAQEAAGRLRRMVPPQALGVGPTQAEQTLQLQNHQIQMALSETLKKLGKEQLKLTDKAELRDIETYRAETDRMKALADQLSTDPAAVQQMISELVRDAAQTHLVPLLTANAKDLGEGEDGAAGHPAGPANATETAGAPMPGARLAPDGKWYLPDPTRPGKHLRIDRKAGA
jgi:Phage P22-like portal protein